MRPHAIRPIVPRLVSCLGCWSLLLAGAVKAQGPPASTTTPPPGQVPPAGERVEPRPTGAVARPPRPVESATAPVPKTGAWMKQHEGYVARASQGDVDLLFLGDSITANWKSAPDVWKRYYAPRRAANFGIGGDRTQHVLWRLAHGEADGIRPKVIVLLIGTNNIASNPEAEVVAGVRAVVDSLREKFPESKVLLLGLLPRKFGPDRDKSLATMPPDPRVGRINTQLATFDDGKAIRYLDIGRVFLDEQGQIPRALMPDFLHLTPGAYQKWADAIEPTLWELMEGK